MKTKLTLTICTLLMSMAAFSQDVIIYRNGIELNAKVVEITSTEVKYKKLENPDGPVYSAAKADIFMVKYENGTKDVFSLTPAPPVEAKKEQEKSDRPEIRHYGGPRVGFTFVGPGLLADDLNAQGKRNVFSQFGWQFETRMFTLENGLSGLVELVPLVSMIDMGKFTPSVTAIMGLRTKNGGEFGAGPSFSLYTSSMNGTNAGFGMVIVAGVSIKSGKACFPINIAVEPSVNKRITTYTQEYNSVSGFYNPVPHTKDMKTGVKVSLLVGFNSRVR